MEGFDKIRNMNLADLDRPDEASREDDVDLVKEVDELDNQEIEELLSEEPVEEKKETWTPQGEYYKVDARMNAGILREFMFKHAYTSSPMLIVLQLLGVAAGVYSYVRQPANAGLLMIACICIVLGYPLSFVSKANSVMKRNPVYQCEFHYIFDEWGLHLNVKDQDIEVEWKFVTKFKKYKRVAAIHTGKNNAYLLPYEALAGNKDTVLAFIERKQLGAKNK